MNFEENNSCYAFFEACFLYTCCPIFGFCLFCEKKCCNNITPHDNMSVELQEIETLPS